MTPNYREMSLNLMLHIASNFGSYDKFKQEFIYKAKSHFGSGWIWLVKNIKTSKLEIINTHDAYNPLTDCKYLPLLVLDVWEHAYYIDERNDRETYINNWFKIINWDFVERNLKLSQ
jgi:Fe-Mn family superoxide dismutase